MTFFLENAGNLEFWKNLALSWKTSLGWLTCSLKFVNSSVFFTFSFVCQNRNFCVAGNFLLPCFFFLFLCAFWISTPNQSSVTFLFSLFSLLLIVVKFTTRATFDEKKFTTGCKAISCSFSLPVKSVGGAFPIEIVWYALFVLFEFWPVCTGWSCTLFSKLGIWKLFCWTVC